MKTRVISVGKLSLPFLRDGVADYAARISRYIPFNQIELREEKGGKSSDPVRLIAGEGSRILGKVPSGAFLVVLDEAGKQLGSEDLADLFRRLMNSGTQDLAWVIGGPYGLSPDVKNRGDLVLSLSSMTLPHQLARLILFEQIYRAMTILRGEPYHH